jgi:hypothetical protein
MSIPNLTPKRTTSAIVLPSTGTVGDDSSATGYADSAAKTSNYPFGIYVDTTYPLHDVNFISGASDQVAYTYKKLGGDILDVELTVSNIYSAYEEACLEYSYQINIHQAKNVLSDLLGMSTGTFNHDGQMTGGDASGSAANLALPRFEFRYARRQGEGLAQEAGFAGGLTEYSASFKVNKNQQEYDLQSLIYSSSVGTDPALGVAPKFENLVGKKKVKIRKVIYKTPQSMWRFFGYYGGLNAVGNLNNYGQFSDDTTFEIIPTWQNKLQAQAFEDHIFTRLSHFSYEISNNKLKLYPVPNGEFPNYMWVTFTVEKDGWTEDADRKSGMSGINNVNALPFENIPYKNINSIGKQWIRRYALALTKEVLGQVRGKFGVIPIPGESVTLNSSELLGQSTSEQQTLKDELKSILDDMSYRALAEKDAALLGATSKVLEEVPLFIYQG